MREFWMFDGLPSDNYALCGPEGTPVTYGMLSRMADVWAGHLQQMTAGHRCLVAIELEAQPNSIAAYLGALRAGYPALVLDPGQIASGSGIVAAWNPEICIPAGATLPSLRHAPVKGAPEPHSDLRVLLSTSGSTGDPKLVRLSARNIAANAISIADYLCLTPEDRAATTLPLHYSYGLSVLNSYLSVGACLVLLRPSVTGPAFWAEARTAGVTSLAFVPHQMEVLAHGGFAGSELPSLRYMTQAGGKLSPDLARQFTAMARQNGWELFIMYGQTEAAPRISYVPPSALPDAADTIGRAVPGGHLWLAAEDGTEITAQGQPGELVYEGPNVMMGYATTRDDLLRGQEMTELRTGDIAELSDTGFFRIVGRMKRFVKLYGLRISLDQVEAFLTDHGVKAQAVAVDDKLVILHHDPETAPAAIVALADAYALPLAAFHSGHLAEVPRLASGKPDQLALRQIAEEILQASGRAQATEGLAEAMKRATRSKQVGPDDSFNGLGGDSLSYLQMQMALEERLGQSPQGWENMPLAQLEAMAKDTIGGEATHGRVGIDVLLRLAAITLVVVQHATDYPLYGGTWMLIALMGYSMARFQLQQIAAGQPFRLIARLLYPIIPLYFMILGSYALLRDTVDVSYIFLFANYRDFSESSFLELYWFVSIYAQLVLCLMFAAAVPILRKTVAKDPWGTIAFVSAANAIVFCGVIIWYKDQVIPYHPQRGLVECFAVFSLGWMIQCWQGRTQILVTLLLSAITIFLLVLIGISNSAFCLLVFTLIGLGIHPKIQVQAFMGRLLNTLASVTLYVYLLHQVFVHYLREALLPQPIVAVLAVLISFSVALYAQRFLGFLESLIPVNQLLHSNSRR